MSKCDVLLAIQKFSEMKRHVNNAKIDSTYTVILTTVTSVYIKNMH